MRQLSAAGTSQLARVLVDTAVWFLPADGRGRYHDEWLAELGAMERERVTPLVPSLRILLGAPSVGRALRARRRRTRVPREGTMLDNVPDAFKQSVAVVVSGVVTYLVANVTGLDLDIQLLFTCFISAAVAFAQILVSLEKRLKDFDGKLDGHHAAMGRLVGERLAGVGEVVELFGFLERAPAGRETATTVLRPAKEIDASSPVVSALAYPETEPASGLLSGPGHGVAARGGEHLEGQVDVAAPAGSVRADADARPGAARHLTRAVALSEAGRRRAEHDAWALAEVRADLEQLRAAVRDERACAEAGLTRVRDAYDAELARVRAAYEARLVAEREHSAERLAVLAEARADVRTRAERAERLADDLAAELRATRAGLAPPGPAGGAEPDPGRAISASM
jgi:hypothetical protein